MDMKNMTACSFMSRAPAKHKQNSHFYRNMSVLQMFFINFGSVRHGKNQCMLAGQL